MVERDRAEGPLRHCRARCQHRRGEAPADCGTGRRRKTVTTHLLADLVDRGLDVEQGVLVVLDGSKRSEQLSMRSSASAVQRCIGQERKVLDHSPSATARGEGTLARVGER